ncbi:hypothetical protein A3A76_00135 [Candidatus Woesebacteria bacterium RIFCSPLOWO2_01_FULL_39_23]|uniref:protein O-GlcNAc transferase n=1 Tax=Candidatus Woesebacteria bacterium RIFCSPHIGHO2_01_FULL_40_22 TaxID=1802499 RepID=A0A1F7YG32_9BACT|nr:MAG: hypothetical protein A2628_03755 [Candidatus Woesebacteria bacterium RIFCSPHIGHO2_01_FULL_40_22]OGM36658.1 MAG: hypothetical protein A3E41_01980 [Candidatus Woesebacteria bacterium RIFCSPHIGHO2_12_FULL_38_9]OGM62846.1 MAG: hypothetical protein A3A76_00135 [Candidatus Woesebacteria bacterium RIFCSPLOWO2_01_FULL_39_23]
MTLSAQDRNRKAIALANTGNLDRAIEEFNQAYRLDPEYQDARLNLAVAYNNRGVIFQERGFYDNSLADYKNALRFNPCYPETFNNLGNLLVLIGKLDEAVKCYLASIKLNPGSVESYCNLGMAYKDLGKRNEAIAAYKKTIELDPENRLAYVFLINLLRYRCEWRTIKKLEKKLKKVDSNELIAGETPFINITRSENVRENFEVARIWGKNMGKPASLVNLKFSFQKRKKKILHIGYLSNDFRNHAVAHLDVRLFELHNRSAFKVFGYSYGEDDNSYYRKYISKSCDKFLDVRRMDNAEAAKTIYNDKVDILVDLTGHTRGNRLEICAFKPAPLQVTWLGFPGTTGASFMDYIIADRVLIPKKHQKYYSEKVVYMQGCYQITDNTQVISDKIYTRADFGLPERGVIFAAFNQAYKIEPRMFDIWMEILKDVSGSVLWQLESDDETTGNLKKEARVRGVDPERVIIAPRLNKSEHLARHKLADIGLDTYIVNGHTTSSDCLWAGLPYITLMGSHFASRVAASILTAAGLPELITHGFQEYKNLVVHLANHPEELLQLRLKLKSNRLTYPLFDTELFVKNLEKVYEIMWERYLGGLKPGIISLP